MTRVEFEPFEFQVRDGEPLTLESAVYQALGAASVCWDNMENTGIFQSEKAKDIAETLIAKIKELYFAPQEYNG